MLLYTKEILYTDSAYVGKTSQQLEERIRQHTPKFIRNQVKPQKDLSRRHCQSTQNAPILDSDSAIGQHLLDNKFCVEKFDINYLQQQIRKDWRMHPFYQGF